jgi:hypothetical protein
MGTAMRRLSIPRDVPEDIETLLAKDKQSSEKQVAEADDTSIASLDPPTQEEMKAAIAETDAAQAEVDPNAPKVPNFVGKTVQDVMQEATSQGVDVRLVGSGMSRAQTPPAGTVWAPGTPIQVRFSH